MVKADAAGANAAPSVTAEHCLNQRHRAVGCTRCTAGCPTFAIRLSAGRPELDPEACVACGACSNLCPTAVFNGKTPRLERILAANRSDRKTGALGVGCGQQEEPGTTKLPVGMVAAHGRCLASLDVTDLLELSSIGKNDVWLDDSLCDECAIGSVRWVISSTATTANALLDIGGASARIHLAGETDLEGRKSRSVPVIDGTELHVTRRGLFRNLRARAAEAVAAGAAEPRDDRMLPQRIPSRRSRLLRQLEAIDGADHEIDSGAIPFADVRVDPVACSACGLCAGFCPTGALGFIADGKAFTLSFRASTCLDCAVCAIACPEGAITYGTSLPASAVTGSIMWSLAGGDLTACSECKVLTAADDGGHPVCSSCRHGAGAVRPLDDGAGLLDDLLSHLPLDP